MKLDKYKVNLQLAKKQLTQRQLSAMINISEVEVSRIISGKEVRPATIGAFAEAFDCDVEDIIEKERDI